MTEQEAVRLVRRMYASHGKKPMDEWVDELATEMVLAECHPCAKACVEAAMSDGPAPLSKPRFRMAYRGRHNSDAHAPHVMATDKELEVGEREAFWRSEAVDEIASHVGGDRPLAELIAASMWGSQSVPAIRSVVADEMAGPLAPARGNLWTGAARARYGDPTEAKVAEAWKVARRIATVGHRRWFEEEKAAGRV